MNYILRANISGTGLLIVAEVDALWVGQFWDPALGDIHGRPARSLHLVSTRLSILTPFLLKLLKWFLLPALTPVQ